MKKSKVLSVMLTLAVVFTMCFAGAGSAFAATTDTQLSTEITAVDYNEALKNEDVSATGGYVEYAASKPYTLDVKTPKKGTVNLSLVVTAQTGITVTDANGGYVKTSSSTVAASESQTDYRNFYFSAPTAGTYKVTFSAATDAAAVAWAYYMPAGGTLVRGTEFFGASPDGKVSYYKVTAPSTGYFTIEIPHGNDDPAYYSVKLMNSKKKSLFKKGYEAIGESKDYTTYTGVTKGTYYIAVKTSDLYYGLKVKFTKVSEKSGSKKSKAVAIGKGKSKSGIITAAQSASSGDWYKITLKKSQKVNIVIQTKSSQGGNYGGLKLTFYGASNITDKFNYMQPNGNFNYYTIGSSKLRAGTYYFKVQKYDDGNGYYKITWK